MSFTDFIIYFSQDGRAVQGAAFRSQSSFLGEGSNPSSDIQVIGQFKKFVLHSSCVKIFLWHSATNQADVAEWLRRLTRNQFPSGSVGSNPTICAAFCYSLNIELHFNITLSQIQITQRNASLDDFNDT